MKRSRLELLQSAAAVVAILAVGAVSASAQVPSGERPPAGANVDRRADGSPGFYNNLWLDGSTAWVPTLRTSLIVDPPDGLIPFREGG